MHRTVEELRERVLSELNECVSGAATGVLRYQPFGPDLSQRLQAYGARGKLLRGVLVSFGQLLFSDQVTAAAISTGVVMELLQSFLLIHDDVMDNDDFRRGLPAMHTQYAREESLQDRSDRRHYGLSQAICAGDVAAFMAIHVLNNIDMEAGTRKRLLDLVSKEIIATGLAQMQDVHHGYVDEATREQIEWVYTFKTGRYTFSLPLAAGAVLAGAGEEALQPLFELGERLGRVFQVKDDELGLFGSADQIGKSVGGDIRENKQTLLRWELFNRSSRRSELAAVFGKKDLTENEIAFVRREAEICGAVDAVHGAVQVELSQIRTLIAAHVEWRAKGAELLTWLVDYVFKRAA